MQLLQSFRNLGTNELIKLQFAITTRKLQRKTSEAQLQAEINEQSYNFTAFSTDKRTIR